MVRSASNPAPGAPVSGNNAVLRQNAPGETGRPCSSTSPNFSSRTAPATRPRSTGSCRSCYDDLRRIARVQLRRRRGASDTLDTAVLVHEAYMRLVDQSRASWRDRGHFFAVSAIAMRQIVIDHARRRARLKRGGDQPIVPLDEANEPGIRGRRARAGDRSGAAKARRRRRADGAVSSSAGTSRG